MRWSDVGAIDVARDCMSGSEKCLIGLHHAEQDLAIAVRETDAGFEEVCRVIDRQFSKMRPDWRRAMDALLPGEKQLVWCHEGFSPEPDDGMTDVSLDDTVDKAAEEHGGDSEDWLYRCWETHVQRGRTKPTDKRLSERQRRFCRLFWLLAEVGSGGLEQYYWNWTGQLAVETVADLQYIGAMEAARALERANACFPNGPSQQQRKRRGQIASTKRETADVWLASEQIIYHQECFELLRSWYEGTKTRELLERSP
jgi:hypothetical protein